MVNLMASPFAAHLGTNYCPEDDEVLQIKSILVEPTLRLKRLDDEIAQLQKAIDKLAEEHDGLETFVAAHKAVISPVRRLPLDIMEEIFVACIPTHRNCVMSASEAPVLLGRICSSWRTITLSTPRLWAKLHIVEPPRGGHASFNTLVDEKVAQRLEIAKMWLGRSGQCPLSISFQSGPDEHNPFPTSPSHSLCGQFLQALIPFAPRWQHIRFATPLSAFEAMIHLTQTEVPMLETVAFHPQSHFFHENMKWEELPILGSSRISGFSTTADCFVFEKSLLRWHQLTDLAIEGPVWRSGLSIDMILHTLASCPELRSCKLAVSGIISEIQHSLVELQFLHTLDLEFGNVALTAMQLLDRLSLPGLLNFTLNGNRLPNGTPDAQLSLASFFALCTQLESLKIDSNAFSKSSLLDSLRSLPSTLRRLTVHDNTHGLSKVIPCLDDDVLAVLTLGCPSLETLSINFCGRISDVALLRFITARMTGESGTTLKHVKMQLNRQMTLDILPRLEPFIESGLDVSIDYFGPLPTDFSPWKGLPDVPYPWGSNANQ